MKSQKDPNKNRFNIVHFMYITVIITSICLVGANVFFGSRNEKVRVLCDSGSFFDRIKDEHPETDVVAVNPDVIRDENFSSTTVSEIININTATAEELQTLSGIGETKAAAIIQYRTENGAFSSVEEICRVKGIGDATFNKIRDRITV